MKRTSVQATIGLLLIVSASFSARAGSDRTAADLEAKKRFLELHFFADGRGMHLVPGVLNLPEGLWKKLGFGTFDQTFQNRWGINVVDHQPIGIFNVPYEKMKVGVLGCVACHSGRAAGIFVPGLGNKNVDVAQIGRDAFKIQKFYRAIGGSPTDPKEKEIERSALEFAGALSNDQLSNLSQGMVPVSFVRTWFYKQAKMEIPKSLTKGAVKIPALWGYGEKRKTGQFSDGFGNGDLPGWAVAVELTAGQTPETVLGYREKIDEAENLFADFLPPKYPFAVDGAKAMRGEKIFESHCTDCHGTYTRDDHALPVFEAPQWIPLEAVKTDDDRLNANTDEFMSLVDTNPLRDILQRLKVGKGYFAPRLVGIWARFPYLHHGAVPSLKALLTSPEKRPEAFSLEKSGEKERFDQSAVGLTLPSTVKDQSELLNRAKKGDRDVYYIKRVGHSNAGHDFGTALSDAEKMDLIEYLKTI